MEGSDRSGLSGGLRVGVPRACSSPPRKAEHVDCPYMFSLIAVRERLGWSGCRKSPNSKTRGQGWRLRCCSLGRLSRAGPGELRVDIC